MTVHGSSATILTDDPKTSLGMILEVARRSEATLEWLNVRQNTLEDVFLESVANGGAANGHAQSR